MPAPGADTLLIRTYRGVAGLILPLAWRSVARKLTHAGVPPERRRERLGHATAPRPDGRLVWFHAASVGESLSVLTLIDALADRLEEAQFLVTSGTASSAELLGARLPPRARHQFAPLDAPGPVARFLAHWRPDAAVFVESELWPNTLAMTKATGAPLALINARLSAGTIDGWRRFPATAAHVLGLFDLIVTQNGTTRDALLSLGADPSRVRPGVNLKSTSAPLPVDADLARAMRTALGHRPVWASASTHPGEEEQVLAAATQVLERHPGALLILVPRHPDRRAQVAELCRAQGLETLRRSDTRALPADSTQVYLADTLGELGTWYDLAPVVFLGGSLSEIGGHNPFEPAHAAAAILTGRHVHNFSESFTPLVAAGGAHFVDDAQALADHVIRWFDDPAARQHTGDTARTFASRQDAALATLVEDLVTALHLDG